MMTAHRRDRLADAIRAQIRSGQLQPGDRLPSIPKLKAQGWVVGRQGDGVYVVDHPPV